MDDSECGSIVELAKSNSDSGIDGFLSDGSTSSSKSDRLTETCNLDKNSHGKQCTSSIKSDRLAQTCIFEKNSHGKQSKQLSKPHHCSLSHYSISGRCIETLSPKTFRYLSSCVRVLDLSNNKIKTLPETISELQNLQEINLSCNQLVNLPDSFAKLQKLQTLNLSENIICEPPRCLEFGLERLTHLDLSKNGITKFPKSPKCSPLLQCLNLSHNDINLLPLWLLSEECRAIEELDVSFNFCFDDPALERRLPLLKHHRTSALKSLKKLLISNTGSKPVHLFALNSFESLQHVHLGNLPGSKESENYITDLDLKLFYDPNNILELHLPTVGLALLPENIDRFKNLQVLDASYNKLDWLPDKIVTLKFLRELILSDCSLSHLPSNFNELKSLEKLVLDRNQLTDVEKCLDELPRLAYVDLYDNLLESLPISPDCLPNIQMVDFAFNFVNLEEALDKDVNGENLFNIYCHQQERLRSSSASKQKRYSERKIQNIAASFESLESEFRHYTSESESDAGIPDEIFLGEPCNNGMNVDENWDLDSCDESDYFDCASVPRYSLPLGYIFGWTPPVKPKDCQVPINQQASGFLFIPGQLHQRTTVRKRRREDLPVVDGQFDDACVDTYAGLQSGKTLIALLEKMHMFVRNPAGMRTRRRCRTHGQYDFCCCPGVWFQLSPPFSFIIPSSSDM
ncbi:leucine-rich repeat protein SHOC-2-like [Macrosteles quadrilineatus]|uniref:leucine-rich repeat protein SHOC-2-like n=1 Tax=Macrosteles quadrilineatus TaxID=74068 RepID=UPI0023E29F61|nr:leucine-rich repeat protein SHOC-2-like [Macrosteles quadrilineatus]